MCSRSLIISGVDHDGCVLTTENMYYILEMASYNVTYVLLSFVSYLQVEYFVMLFMCLSVILSIASSKQIVKIVDSVKVMWKSLTYGEI